MLKETIKDVKARIIVNSRAEKTLEVELVSSHWHTAMSSVPGGKSTGAFEAKTVPPEKAIEIINQRIKPEISGFDIFNQEDFDKLLLQIDGTANKSNIGANTTLALSQALIKLASASLRLPTFQYIHGHLLKNRDHSFSLPTPCFNVINGGLHADSDLPFQEFLLIPKIKSNFQENFFAVVSIYQKIKEILAKFNFSTNLGDEGGFAPKTADYWQVFLILKQAVEAGGWQFGKDIFLGIDAAADNIKTINHDELLAIYQSISQKYPLIYLEDGFGETEEEDWKSLMTALGAKCLIVGDDLIATNLQHLAMAVEKHLINAIIVKPNQIGTITEVLAVIKMAREHNVKIIVSHRSGETNDEFLADLAVGVSADAIKAGAPARGERLAKYNRLLRIEETLGGRSEYRRIYA